MLVGQYCAQASIAATYYAKAQNLAPQARAPPTIERWRKYDLLLMPTLPIKRATPLPDPAGPRMDIIQRAFEMLPNTAPFDVTGHPGDDAALRPDATGCRPA